MHPALSAGLAREHRRDLRTAAGRRRAALPAPGGDPLSRTWPSLGALHARVGWLLIGVGAHLVARHLEPVDVACPTRPRA